MRGSDLAEAMALAVDRIVSVCEGTVALDRAIEAVVGTIGGSVGRTPQATWRPTELRW